MGTDYGKEARKQYLKYFRGWFIIIGILLIILIALLGIRSVLSSDARGNNSAPAERVYDYADVLTDEEEERLCSQIASAEINLRMDIVIVTFSQSVEGMDAAEEYNYRSVYWEDNMEDLADDFWDKNGYGYNKSFEGDGVLLLHNWYEGQNGEWMSTSGRAERELSDYAMDNILYKVDRYYESDPYRAYSEFVKAVEEKLAPQRSAPMPWVLVVVLPIAVAVSFASMNLVQSKDRNTTAVNAYVAGGKPVLNAQQDELLRKNVTKQHINTSSGSGGGGHSRSYHSGGGGHHRSSGGASHGGRGHRH